MKYLIITFINLFLYIQLSGQEHLFEFSPNKPIQTNEIKKNNKNYLKIAPLGFVTSAYELGYERLLNSTYSIELSLTYFDHFENSYYTRNNGYRVLMDQRYYFDDNYPSRTKTYFGLEAYYMYKEFQQEQTQVVDRDSYGWFGVNYIYATDLFMIKRSYIAFAPKLGYQKQYESGFLLDCYFGIGLRFIDTEIYSVNGILEEYLPYEEIQIFSLLNFFDFWGYGKRQAHFDFEPRKFTQIYIPLNLKIGYVF